MGKMYTLKPDESINDHMKESITMLDDLVKSIDVDYYHNSTMIKGIKPDTVRYVIEHIRNTIEMLDELTDELEDREDEVRREYEERVVRFFNNWMNSDMSYEYKSRAEEAVKRIHEIENHYMSEIQKLNEDLDHFRDLAISRNEELEQERERSNQLEEKNRKVKTQFELAKKFLHLRREEVSRLKEELRQTQLVKDAQKKVIDEIWGLQEQAEYWELQEQAEYWEDLAKKIADQNGCDITSCYPKTMINNPANFCGNCANCEQHPNDVYICKHYYKKVVDPDDASCSHFKPNNSVVIGKPEFPCCDHCNHEDCDDCTLCPF